MHKIQNDERELEEEFFFFFRGGLTTPHGPQITRSRRQNRRARLMRARLCPTHARAASIEVLMRGAGGRRTIFPSSRYGTRNAHRHPPNISAATMPHSTSRL